MRREEEKKRKEPVLIDFSRFHRVRFHVGSLNNRCLPLMFSKKRILQTKKIQLPARVHRTPAGTGFLFNYKQNTQKAVHEACKGPINTDVKKHLSNSVRRIDFSHPGPLTPNKGKSVRFTVFLQTKPEFVGKKNRSPLKRAEKIFPFCLASCTTCPLMTGKYPFFHLSCGYGYGSPHIRFVNNLNQLQTVTDRETGFMVHGPMTSSKPEHPYINLHRDNGQFKKRSAIGSEPLFPVSRQHVPERHPGFIVDFDVHDNFSLSKERVNQTTSNDQGFNEYLNLLKKSERFRRPARVPKTMAGTGSLPLKKKRKSNFSPRRHEGHEGKKKR